MKKLENQGDTPIAKDVRASINEVMKPRETDRSPEQFRTHPALMTLDAKLDTDLEPLSPRGAR